MAARLTSARTMARLYCSDPRRSAMGLHSCEADAAASSWKAFGQDPDWLAAREASEKNGKLLDKAPDSTYMKATDFSPAR